MLKKQIILFSFFTLLLLVSCNAQTTTTSSTQVPSTAVPTTVAPTTATPKTAAPTTQAPTTQPPTTQTPTTQPPTTQTPTTQAPTTAAPTTESPTTQPPTTEIPTTDNYLQSFVDSFILYEVIEEDFYLPAELLDIVVTWTTDDDQYLNIGTGVVFHEGEFAYLVQVNRPEYLTGNQWITITGVFNYNNQDIAKDFPVVVLAYPALHYLEQDLELILSNYVVEDEFSLPALMYSSYINISISEEISDYISYEDGLFTIVRPAVDKVGTLSFDITFGEESLEVEVELTLLAIPKETTYIETLSWVTTTSNAYANTFSNVDDNGFSWSLRGRGDMAYFALGNSADASFVQVTATGGISSFSIDLVRAFTNSNARTAELFINGTSYGTFSISTSSDEWQTFTVNNINIYGEVVIRIVSISPGDRGAFLINNFTWTTYTEDEVA